MELDTDLCPDCNKLNTGYEWCEGCNTKRFQQDFSNWTSGNELIDGFIQETQLNAQNNDQILEWIPYNKLKINHYDKKGDNVVYQAIWLDGPIQKWS